MAEMISKSKLTVENEDELKKYREIMNCLSHIAEKLNENETGAIIELMDQCWKIIHEVMCEEKESLFVDSLNQVAHLMKWQRKVLFEKILNQCVQLEPNFSENTDLATASVAETLYRVAELGDTSCTPQADCKFQEKAKAELRRNAITSTKQNPGSGGLDSIAGLSVAKKLLREAVVLPTRFPQLFTGGRRAWNRILLYGPPGTGKTRLAQAIASEVGATFYSVSSADILSSWVGESEKLIRELFQYTRSLKEQSIIFIDEIDGICRQRTSREEEHTRRMKTQLLSQLEGTGTEEQDNTFILCATNCPWELDLAFLRRFQRRVYIPLPDKNARHQIIQFQCNCTEVKLSEADWQLLLDCSNGYSGSDLANLTLSALMEPVREIDSCTHWAFTSNGKLVPSSKDSPGVIYYPLQDIPSDLVGSRPVLLRDFLKALTNTPCTVSKGDIERFDQFTLKFGQVG